MMKRTTKRLGAVRGVRVGAVAAAVSAVALAVALPAMAGGPSAPIIAGSLPGSGSDDNSPAIYGAAQRDAVVTIYASKDCTGAVAVSSNEGSFWFRGLEVSVPDNSETTFSATATSPGGVSACSDPYVYREVSRVTKHHRKKHKRKHKSG